MSLDQYFMTLTSVDELDGITLHDGDSITYEDLEKYFHLCGLHRMDGISSTRMEYPQIVKLKIANPIKGMRTEGFASCCDEVLHFKNNFLLQSYIGELYECGVENCIPIAVDREDLEELIRRAEVTAKAKTKEERELHDYYCLYNSDRDIVADANIIAKAIKKMLKDYPNKEIFVYEEWY